MTYRRKIQNYLFSLLAVSYAGCGQGMSFLEAQAGFQGAAHLSTLQQGITGNYFCLIIHEAALPGENLEVEVGLMGFALQLAQAARGLSADVIAMVGGQVKAQRLTLIDRGSDLVSEFEVDDSSFVVRLLPEEALILELTGVETTTIHDSSGIELSEFSEKVVVGYAICGKKN